MSLHPDDRPESIKALSNFLFEGGAIPPGTSMPPSGLDLRALALLRSRADSILAWGVASLLFLSLLATLIR
jgi:hypothetical protein